MCVVKTGTIRVVVGTLACASSLIAAGQDASSAAKAPQLRVVLLRNARATVQEPIKVTVRLVNDTDTTLMLPKPLLHCQGDNGYITVHQKLLSPAKNPESGRSCAADRWGRRDVLAEAETSWVTLAPAASYEMTDALMFANHGARYEIRAAYFPARFTEEELRTLVAHRINVIQTHAESAPLILRSPH